MSTIRTDGLTKRFGRSVVAVDDVSFEVEQGEVFGFLGPNGAGKSTTIDLLLGFLTPTSGEAYLLGHDVSERSVQVRERVGILPEGTSPYDRLTAREHLEFVADCKGVDEDIDELLAGVGLSPAAADRQVGEFSKGMTQRLRLGMALVGDPDVLILDEPSSGLDPTGISEMRELLRDRAAAGATVFFSSHILSEVEELCDRVGILNDGQLVAVDTIDELRAVTAPETTLTIAVGNADRDPLEVLAAHEAVSDAWKEDDRFCASVDGGEKASVLTALENAGITVDDFSVDEASLEELFTAYMGGDRRAQGVES